VASGLFGRDHKNRHAECRRAVERLCGWLSGPELVPAAPGLRNRLWWATGSGPGMDAAAECGAGVLSGKPGDADVVADLRRYRVRAVGEPRIALSRIVRHGDTAADLVASWRTDPALALGQELIVQTQLTGGGPAEERAVMRTVVDDVLPELVGTASGAPVPEPAR
jgi:hypothetical protein